MLLLNLEIESFLHSEIKKSCPRLSCLSVCLWLMSKPLDYLRTTAQLLLSAVQPCLFQHSKPGHLYIKKCSFWMADSIAVVPWFNKGELLFNQQLWNIPRKSHMMRGCIRPPCLLGRWPKLKGAAWVNWRLLFRVSQKNMKPASFNITYVLRRNEAMQDAGAKARIC